MITNNVKNAIHKYQIVYYAMKMEINALFEISLKKNYS